MFYKLLKKPFFGRYMVQWKNPLSESEKYQWKKVSAISKSGAIIHGLFVNAIKEIPKATIVFGHPMGKEAKGYFIKNGYTDFFRENGYNVLVFDMNGFGESSQGNFSYFEDIIAIGKETKKLSSNLKIGYFGISLGANMATIAFANKENPYQFAVLESAATTLNEFWKIFPAAYKTLKVLNLLLPKYTNKIKMIDRIKETKNLQSILFIYSQIDNWVPLEMGKKFQENCNVKSELFVLKNAQHANISKSIDKELYFNKILNYFNNESC